MEIRPLTRELSIIDLVLFNFELLFYLSKLLRLISHNPQFYLLSFYKKINYRVLVNTTLLIDIFKLYFRVGIYFCGFDTQQVHQIGYYKRDDWHGR